MKTLAPFLTLGMIASLLAGALLLQLPIWRKENGHRLLPAETTLAKRLPANLPGGSAHDEPIAATEEMKKAVGELLNYNDGIYRVYQLADVRISVYAAWWEAGRMSPRLVATHTPDVCWPVNGWVRDQAAERQWGRALPDRLALGGFAEGETRVFMLQNKPEYVVFWHKVGQEFLSYTNGWAPPWWAWLDELWRGGLNLRKEQLFIRISANQPLENVWDKAEFLPLRHALLELGLGNHRAMSE